MKLIATRKAEQNRTVLDPWTVVHFGTGLAFGLTSVPLRWGLAAAAAYEIAEQVLERQAVGHNLFNVSGPEVWPNAVADLVVFAAGQWLGRAWNERT